MKDEVKAFKHEKLYFILPPSSFRLHPSSLLFSFLPKGL